MCQFSENPHRIDPCKQFKFRVKWDVRYVVRRVVVIRLWQWRHLRLAQRVDFQAETVGGRTEFGINVIYDIADRFYVYLKHIKCDDACGIDATKATGLVYTL